MDSSCYIVIAILVLLFVALLGFGMYLLFRPNSSGPSNNTYVQKVIAYSDNDPGLQEIPHFLSNSECDSLIREAETKGLVESAIYGSGGSDILNPDIRKSSQAWLDPSSDRTAKILSDKVAKYLSIPSSHQELIQVATYGPGGKFNPHYDACAGSNCQRMNASGGPRYKTVLIYLNDNFTGGITSFPTLGKSIRPEKGKAIVFTNIDPVTEAILSKSYHAGDPVLSGHKWISNVWVHLRPR